MGKHNGRKSMNKIEILTSHGWNDGGMAGLTRDANFTIERFNKDGWSLTSAITTSEHDQAKSSFLTLTCTLIFEKK